MLNLKKGLALVLAAATAFTFAPVSTLTASAAATTSDDGYTKSTGIDSVDFTSFSLKNDSTDKKTIILKEHDDKSSDGTKVKGYRIQIQRAVDKDDSTKYTSVIDVTGAGPTDYDSHIANNDSFTSTVTPDTTWGDTSGTNSSWQPNDYTFVENKDGYNPNLTTTQTAASATLYRINGAYVTFKFDQTNYTAANTNDTSFKVTVYALDSTTPATAKTLDKSVFTINLKQDGLDFAIDTTNVPSIVAENALITVPFKITDNGTGSKHPTAMSVAVAASADGYVRQHTGTDAEVAAGKTFYKFDNSTPNRISGFVTVKALQTGSITVKIQALGKNDDYPAATDIVVGEKTFKLKITEGNGHLYVSYNTDRAGRLTFTDDPAVTNSRQTSANPLVRTQDSIENQIVSANGESELQVQSKKTSAGTWVFDNTDQFIKGIPTDDNGNAYKAQTLVANGQKTVQIEASATPGAKISYALIARDGWYNKATNSKAYTGENANNGNYLIYSEKAAAPYGAVDQNGLVTIKKDEDVEGGLYVVVTAQGSAKTETTAARKTSTYIVPITLSANDPAYVYVSDKENTADAQTYYNDAQSSWVGQLYLSLKGRKSTDLVTSTNAGESYLKITSSDPSVVKVSGKTVTAVKKGDAIITVQNSASPQVSGIAVATLKVTVNENAETTAVSGKGVSVNKEKPYAQIEVTPSASDANVKFDGDLYKADSNYPSGYSKILAKDDHYQDVTVSSTGHVAYQRNSGTVYARAQVVADDKYNASPYVYIPVNYGQTVVDTNLTVDQTPVVLEVKGTKQISATASSGASISYTSADPTVASVDANGLVTANKSGYTTVTVAANSADGKTGDSAVITVIVKGNETITDDTVKKPSKVTGVKVTNLKGGKVKVTWTKQNQKNIKYYVKKTVGKKSAGKSVGSNKTTLSVKKGATVKVKVKAYIYDATGKKLVGSYSKTVTKKTDKK